MYTFIIRESGLLINTGKKIVRTPCSIQTKNKDFIELQLKYNSITNYKVINLIEVIKMKSLKKFKSPPFSLGYIEDEPDERDYQVNNILHTPKLSTSYVNYTDEMSPVKNQGSLGSCVGFAMAAMKEWQEQKEYLNEVKKGSKYRRKKDHYNLSEMWIYYKSKEIDPWPNQEGTSIRCAMKQMCKLGAPPEKAWKYNDRVKGKPEPWSHLVSKWRSSQSYFRVNNLNELLQALDNYGPVVIGVYCFKEIFSPSKKGIVKDPANPDMCYGGHAICAVHYNPEKQLVKFKNSWGSNWGNKGYGCFSYDYINRYMMDAWVLIDKNVSIDEVKGK
jgi:C1A family cysteine protease